MTFHARDPQRKIRGSGQPDEEPDEEADRPLADTGQPLADQPAADQPAATELPAPDQATDPALVASSLPSFAPQSKFGAAWGSGGFAPPVAAPLSPPGPPTAPLTVRPTAAAAPPVAAPLSPPGPPTAPLTVRPTAAAGPPVAAPLSPPGPPTAPLTVRPAEAAATPVAAPPLPTGVDDEEPDPSGRPGPTFRELLRRITPAMAILTIGSVGSALFLLRAMTSHTTPIGVLMSAGVVTALVFALDTVILTAATYRESRTGEAGRSLALALLGGISVVICALALAGTLILMLALNR